jgi:hypothetical protein
MPGQEKQKRHPKRKVIDISGDATVFFHRLSTDMDGTHTEITRDYIQDITVTIGKVARAWDQQISLMQLKQSSRPLLEVEVLRPGYERLASMVTPDVVARIQLETGAPSVIGRMIDLPAGTFPDLEKKANVPGCCYRHACRTTEFLRNLSRSLSLCEHEDLKCLLDPTRILTEKQKEEYDAARRPVPQRQVVTLTEKEKEQWDALTYRKLYEFSDDGYISSLCDAVIKELSAVWRALPRTTESESSSKLPSQAKVAKRSQTRSESFGKLVSQVEVAERLQTRKGVLVGAGKTRVSRAVNKGLLPTTPSGKILLPDALTWIEGQPEKQSSRDPFDID